MRARVIRALTAVALLAGCGGDADSRTGTSAGAGGGAPAPITFQVTGDPEETSVFKVLAERYEQRTGGRVRVVEIADRDAHLAKLTTAFSAGRQPDLFLLNYRYLGPFAQKRVIDPVGPRVRNARDFYPVATEAFTVDGTLQCLPQNVSSLAVYFNADAFAEAGLPKPSPRWTYDEFSAAAERVGVGIDVNAIRAMPWIWSEGEDELRFDTPEARRGLERLIRLRQEGWAPDAEEHASRGVDARFLDGELGMLFSSRRDVPLLRTIKDFKWDVAPFPAGERRVSVLHSDGFCLSKGKNTDAAWKFTEYALGPEGQEILAASGRTVPSLRAVAESDAFLGSTPPESNQVFLDAVEGMKRLPNTPDWPAREQRLDDVLDQLFYGKLDVDAAVERITREGG